MKKFSTMEFLAILSLIIIASVANLLILNDLGFMPAQKIVSQMPKLPSLPNVPPFPPVACTEEAKICPDGSAVGRIGPNCDFAPCPGVPDCPASCPACGASGSIRPAASGSSFPARPRQSSALRAKYGIHRRNG